MRYFCYLNHPNAQFIPAPEFKQLCQTVQYDPNFERGEMEEHKTQVLATNILKKCGLILFYEKI